MGISMGVREFREEFAEDTAKVVLLGMVTLGIYWFIWLSERRKPMNKLSDKEIYNKSLMIYAAISSGISTLLASYNAASMAIFVALFNLIYNVLMIVIAWKIGLWLESFSFSEWKIEVKANRFLLIIFNIFYVNYLINKISDTDKNLVEFYN